MFPKLSTEPNRNPEGIQTQHLLGVLSREPSLVVALQQAWNVNCFLAQSHYAKLCYACYNEIKAQDSVS